METAADDVAAEAADDVAADAAEAFAERGLTLAALFGREDLPV